MPLGTVLRDTVADAVNFRTTSNKMEMEVLHNLLRHLYGGDRETLSRYIQAGRRLGAAARKFPSIDEALHYFRNEKEVVEIGKLAIVNIIASCENRSALAVNDMGRPPLKRLDNTWYDHFFSIALAGLTKEKIGRIFDHVTFINFNYDRTLECFIFNALMQYADVNTQTAADIVNHMSIIRPYGSLGAIDWMRKNNLSEPITNDNLITMANQIRTFTEAQEKHLQTAITIRLDEAKLVIVLGFGFHQQNLALFKRGLHSRVVANVFATAKAIHVGNLNRIQVSLSALFGTTAPTISDMAAWEILSELRPSIVQAAT